MINGTTNGASRIVTTPYSSPRKRFSPLTRSRQSFAVLILTAAGVLGAIQVVLNSILFHRLDKDSGSATKADLQTAAPLPTIPHDLDPNRHPQLLERPDLHARLDDLQQQLFAFQGQIQTYVDDGRFFPFSIRDSRRLVPTQVPPGVHVFDYVDITNQNQQKTRRAGLFQDAHFVAKAACQIYDLSCYKQKIVQVFELVLKEYPRAEYFFYMEADNELCVPLTEIRRIAYDYQRYFITTGIGFSGWIMHRSFVVDFLEALKAYKPPARNSSDILDQKGPHPDEGPDPIASVMLIEKNGWTVTRKYLVSHSIQASQGKDALTVKMPSEQAVEYDKDGKPKKKKQLDKHLPRCLEPRRSKWAISKKDHRDRFGWDYFDYDNCEGEVFPCYVGQLEDLLAKDMAQFNYTQLDADRQKLIQRQEERQRKQLIRQESVAQGAQNQAAAPEVKAGESPTARRALEAPGDPQAQVLLAKPGAVDEFDRLTARAQARLEKRLEDEDNH